MTPSKAPKIDTTIKDSLINSSTGKDRFEESALSSNSVIMKNKIHVNPPLSAPQGSAAAFFFEAAKPAMKYIKILHTTESGDISLLGSLESIHIKEHIKSNITADTVAVAIPNNEARSTPTEVVALGDVERFFLLEGLPFILKFLRKKYSFNFIKML